MVDERDEVLDDSNGDDQELNSIGGEETGVVGETHDSAASEAATESLRELTTYLVQNLVDDPETVEISVERRGSSVHIQLRLPEGELGKVIGRGGRIAKAMRTVLLIAGSKHHLRVSLDIES
jgi:predicted RNA-binding protein YlqC (UPF0109 family)